MPSNPKCPHDCYSGVCLESRQLTACKSLFSKFIQSNSRICPRVIWGNTRRGKQRPKQGDTATTGDVSGVDIEKCMESGKDLLPKRQEHDNVSRTSRVLSAVENIGIVDIAEKLVLSSELQVSPFSSGFCVSQQV